MPLNWWTIKEYEKQWKEGLERIKSHDKSCLVVSIYDPIQEPQVEWWILYKEGNKIFVQNHRLFGRYIF